MGGGVHGDFLGERGHAFFAMITDLGMRPRLVSGAELCLVGGNTRNSCAVEQAERILILNEGYPDKGPPQTSRYRPSNFVILRKRGSFQRRTSLGHAAKALRIVS